MAYFFTLSSFTLYLLFLSFCAAEFTQSDTSSGFSFTAELIHRDSPNSPFYNASETSLVRLSNTYLRSANRVIRTSLSPGDGNYVMKIAVGTPPTPLLFSIDSTSNVLWVPCLESQSSCTRKMYNSKASSTYRNVPCSSQHFCTNFCHSSNDVCLYNSKGNSPTGTIGIETVTLTSSTGQSFLIPDFHFVCGSHIGKDFGGVGIAGLGQGPISLTSRLNNFINGKFSYCLTPYNSKKSSKITFGDLHFDASSEVFSMKFKQDEKTGKYLVPLVYLGGDHWFGANDDIPISEYDGFPKATNTRFNMIVDTETLFTRIPHFAFKNFAVFVSYDITYDPTFAFQEHGLKLNWCYRYKEEEFKPKNIRLKINAGGEWDPFVGRDRTLDRTIELGVSNSFIRVAEDVVCLAFEESDDDNYVLGSWQMMDFLVGFDVNNKTMYLQKTDCSKY
ncbi:Eukaryotic aspartyl protease family protein [Euphorbia peplus]|nr:Eukaryotic aspartyl protease family protein [Euphorbia peplus]